MIRIEPSKKMLKHFALAKNLAYHNDSKWKHGAVLVSRGVVVNGAFNSNRPCSFGSRFRCPTKGQATLHAEIGAILNMGRGNTENSDVYVVRVNSDGILRNSKPCEMCQQALKFCGIKRVYYSMEEGNYEVLKL